MKFKILIILLIGLLLSCGQSKMDTKTNAIDGTYAQIGYGRTVVIKNGEFVLYDVTDISTIPALEGSIDMFGDRLTLVNDTLQLVDGINKYHYVRLMDEAAFKVKELSESEMMDPFYNFDVLAKTFDDNYAYFELRNVNWDSLKTDSRAKISPETSEAELYIIMQDMLNSFNDGHIGLSASDEVEEAAEAIRMAEMIASEEDSEELEEYGSFEIATMVAEHYLKDKLKSSRSRLINWGLLEEEIGYIQINLMMGHGDLQLADSLSGMNYLRAYFNTLEESEMTSEAHTRLEVYGIRATIERVLEEFQNTQSLVLDVRFNGGGKDEVGLEIMRHFNPKRIHVLTKRARFEDGYTEANKVFLEASEEPYTKKVYLLTSPESASATEIMVMSSMRLDQVIRVGGDTEGVFSDVMEKILPNGWEVGLSNELYLDTRGNNYEGIGIPPAVDLGYPEDGRELYRQIAKDFEGDKQRILDVIR